MQSDKYDDAVIDELIDRLAEGQSLKSICADPRMPGRRTIHRWMRSDDELSGRIMDAREIGFHDRAERAVEEVRSAIDPIKARVVFDAERWYLGKLSRAFADKPLVVGALVNVDADDAFAAISGALEVAAGRIASCGTSTRPVVIEGKARPGDTAGQLADLAGDGGARLGEDEGRG